MALTVDSLGNPIKVTGTTATIQYIIPKGQIIFVKFVRWYNPATAGDVFVLLSGDGREVVKGYCDSANVSQTIPVFSQLDGIKSNDVDSGELYIYTP